MTQAWARRGLLLEPPTLLWAASHAALPAVDDHEGRTRLYFSPRDAGGRAHIARAPLRVGDDGGLAVGPVEPDPVLAPGPLGAFDDSGVTMSCVVRGGGRALLYYTGWTLGVTVPFFFYVGVAVSEDGGASFTRASPAPVLERDAHDPFLTASPAVLLEEGRWRMWYVSCVDWRPYEGTPRHRYLIKYAESDDGLRWRRDGRVSIPFADEREYALARPCVVRDGDRYRMWFSVRGDAYRTGYAESADGLDWIRDDGAAKMNGPPADWESEMTAYPYVFRRGGIAYMLYNGNGYGATGVGWAATGSL